MKVFDGKFGADMQSGERYRFVGDARSSRVSRPTLRRDSTSTQQSNMPTPFAKKWSDGAKSSNRGLSANENARTLMSMTVRSKTTPTKDWIH
jgi:hypothetical protein